MKNKGQNIKRLKRHIIKGYLYYLFKPSIVIFAEFLTMLVFNVICIIVMSANENNTPPYNIALAIMTGITASGFLAVVTEMSNNFRKNSIRNITLGSLFSFLSTYECNMLIYTGKFDSKKLEKKLLGDLNKEKEETSDIVNDLLCESRAAAVLEVLPELMPLVKDAYENHSLELKQKEVEILKDIISYYDIVVSIIDVALYDYIDFMSEENNNFEYIEKTFGKNTALEIKECIKLDMNDTRKNKKKSEIAKEILLRGEYQLNKMEITLKDIVDEDDNKDNDSYDYMISCYLGKIDNCVIKLTKIVKTEMGYSYVHKLSNEQKKQYAKL